jgi:hypothetical protein
MALSNKPRGLWWSRLHFLVRFLGLTSLLVIGVGLAIAWGKGALAGWEQIKSWEEVRPAAEASHDELREAMHGLAGQKREIYAVVMTTCAGLALLALVVEFLAILVRVSGRRSAVGFNAVVQIALAAMLLIGVNVYIFSHGQRFDWTSDQRFTLPPDIRDQLGQLQGETTIIVYQQHKTFGPLTDKPDAYDYAAERKVVEKVKDLVEEFREFGPQFKVEVLNVEDERFKDKLGALTDEHPQLKDAVAAAPENSIFIVAGDKVQTLSFNQFYQLDKRDSEETQNLVLLKQGVKPFADKVLNVEEKRPVVGVAVIHDRLSTRASEKELTLAGLRKALEARGFAVKDIVVKDWSGPTVEPGVFTYEESKLESLEESQTDLENLIKAKQRLIDLLVRSEKVWRTATLRELNKQFADQIGEPVDEEIRQEQLAGFGREIAKRRRELKQNEDELADVTRQKAKLNVDAAAEQKRMSDVKAKLERALAECDLLIVPRMTLQDIRMYPGLPNVPGRFYRLGDAQVEATKDFLRQGKPILACFGPINERRGDDEQMRDFGPAGPDGLEDLLTELGLRFGKQTVLFNVESKQSRRRRTGLLSQDAAAEVPAVLFDWQAGEGRPFSRKEALQRGPNPLRESLQITARGAGKRFELRLRHPRPIYYEPDRARMARRIAGLYAAAAGPACPVTIPWACLMLSGQQSKPVTTDPEFMMADSDSWNTDQPFPVAGVLPEFERTKEDEKADGTLDQKRGGPFPIGVAVETTVPLEWYAGATGSPKPVRVAAIGQGGCFVGPELKPEQERLLLNTCTYLLGRDEYLPRRDEDQIWSYPRVSLDERGKVLWFLGAVVALPGVFAYLGFVVVMVRWLR